MTPFRSRYRFPAVTFLVIATVATVADSASAQSRPLLQFEIGAIDGPTEITFGGISGITQGPNGEILIADRSAREIRVFAKDGSFLRRFGGRGAGPGEFMLPVGPHVRDSIVTVFDPRQRRLAAFTLAGQHLWTRALPELAGTITTNLLPLSNDRFVVETMSRVRSEHQDPRHTISILDRGDAVMDTLASFHTGSVQMIDESGARNLTPIRMGVGGGWATSGDSIVVIADGHRGWLGFFSISRGAPRLISSLRPDGFEPYDLTQADAEVVEDSIYSLAPQLRGEGYSFRLPPVRSGITGILWDERSGVWLRHGTTGTTGEAWGVLERDGTVATTVSFPQGFELKSVQGDRLIGVATDQLGVERVQIYKWSESTEGR